MLFGRATRAVTGRLSLSKSRRASVQGSAASACGPMTLVRNCACRSPDQPAFDAFPVCRRLQPDDAAPRSGATRALRPLVSVRLSFGELLRRVGGTFRGTSPALLLQPLMRLHGHRNGGPPSDPVCMQVRILFALLSIHPSASLPRPHPPPPPPTPPPPHPLLFL